MTVSVDGMLGLEQPGRKQGENHREDADELDGDRLVGPVLNEILSTKTRQAKALVLNMKNNGAVLQPHSNHWV